MKLLKSFGYAFCGIVSCMCRERNFRIHIVAMITVLLFSRLYQLPLAQYPPLIAIIVVVLATEAINTAVEHAVNLACPTMHEIARVAKDVSAAAVLISAIGAVAIACTIFCDVEALRRVWHLICTPAGLCLLTGYIAVSAVFVFAVPVSPDKDAKAQNTLVEKR